MYFFMAQLLESIEHEAGSIFQPKGSLTKENDRTRYPVFFVIASGWRARLMAVS